MHFDETGTKALLPWTLTYYKKYVYILFDTRFYGVVVSTSDSASGDPSSNLGRTVGFSGFRTGVG